MIQPDLRPYPDSLQQNTRTPAFDIISERKWLSADMLLTASELCDTLRPRPDDHQLAILSFEPHSEPWFGNCLLMGSRLARALQAVGADVAFVDPEILLGDPPNGESPAFATPSA